MKSNSRGRRSFLRNLTVSGLAVTAVPDFPTNTNYSEKRVNVIPSDGVTRTEQELFRDRPSVLDYDGVYNNLSSDSYLGMQNAFDNERELMMPRDFRCLVSEPLIIKRRGFHLHGGSKVATQIHANHDGNVIEVGETGVATGPAPRCVLENFSIFGNGLQTGGIVLWDKNTNTGWADASKGCRLSDLIINDIGAGPALRIRSWANYIEHIETTQGCRYGIIIEQQALTNTFVHPYITGCSKEGLIIGDTPERIETCNTVFIGAIVQQCGGEGSSGAIVIRGAASTAFYDLYLERNGEKGASYDVDISELAVLTEIRNVTSRGAISSALIRDAGVDSIVRNVWRYGSADSIVRRVGNLVTGDYGGFYQASGTLPNGLVRDLATGEAMGRYCLNDRGIQLGGQLEKRKGLTADYTIPEDSRESGWLYHVQSGTSVTITLPANAVEGHIFNIAAAGVGGSLILSAASGATVNGLSSKTLLSDQLYKVACTRNSTGSSAQWMTF